MSVIVVDVVVIVNVVVVFEIVIYCIRKKYLTILFIFVSQNIFL